MALTRVEKSNLARFGCAFSARDNLVFISWPEEKHAQAGAANILVSLVRASCTNGPLLCLAFEISPTKALPHYCFLPLDLSNESHKQYLSLISKQGKIELRFLAGSHRVMRTHEIIQSRRAKMMEIYSGALIDIEKFPQERYDFDRAVSEFEQNVRLADQFEYVLTEPELQRAIRLCHEQAKLITPEKKAQAHNLAKGLLETVQPEYESFAREFMDTIPLLRRNVLLGSDLRHYFEGEYEGFARFLADAIAVHVPKENHRELETIALVLKSLFKLISHTSQAASQGDEKSGAQVEMDFRELMARFAAGEGISVRALGKLLAAFGVPGGQPGRIGKDYSVEYDLRASGEKWSKVTELYLENDLETRAEFGQRAYRDLSPQERAILMHRVHEVLRSFAKRTGRPFPPRKEAVSLATPPSEQKLLS